MRNGGADVGIYLAALATAAVVVLGVWSFIGLNRQEQERLRQAAAASAGDGQPADHADGAGPGGA